MDDEKDPLPTWPDYLWKFPEDKPDDWHYFPICLARVKPRGKWLLLLGVIFSECGSRGYIEHSNKKLMESIGEDDEKVIVRILRAASKRRWLEGMITKVSTVTLLASARSSGASLST